MSRDAIFSVAPHAPFLPTLVDAVLDGRLLRGWPQDNPFWLADVTVVVPTRRAQTALAEAFLRKGQNLLPDIRTFGGEAGDEEPFLPPFEAEPLPSAISALERRLTLARLVNGWAQTPRGALRFASPPHASEVLSLAQSLGELIDEMHVEGVTARDLRNSVTAENLAENWQEALEFLAIALDAWPGLLQAHGRRDATDLRNRRLKRQAETAAAVYGDRPVIAAGSTGSIPATADLLLEITRLPRGAVVLPGVDTTLSGTQHEAMLDDGKSPHGHSQYGLARLLRHLGTTHGAVAELAANPEHPRTQAVRRALALADDTASWIADRGGLSPSALADGFANVSVIAARTEDEEARAVALSARYGLAHGKTVGIVTPDRNLARRIAAELARFDVFVDDAAGAPLFQSAAGRFAREALALVAGRCAPVDLIALLANRATSFGGDRLAVSRLVASVDLALLRGQRPNPGFAGLRAALKRNLNRLDSHVPKRLSEAEGEAIAALFDRLEMALTPLAALLEQKSLTAPVLAQTLLDTCRNFASGGDRLPPDLPGGRELENWAAELGGPGEPGPAFPPVGLDAVLATLMSGFDVPNRLERRTDIEIWGRLEARLQNPDLLIVAALNEDIWPEPAQPGPWLSRGMRLECDLPPPERRQGLAAHDFEMALGNGEVMLAYAARIGDSPALPSRLLQRVDAFLGLDHAKLLRERGKTWLDQARRIDAAGGRAVPAKRPIPSPPADIRPRRLSVTEVETLFRSPYDLYAKHVLGLTGLDALGQEPGGRERGTLVHEVFSRFIGEGQDIFAPHAEQRLNAMAVEAFAGLDSIGDRRDIWLRRFAVAIAEFLRWERERHGRVQARHAEVRGEWSFPELDGFRLTGRADRIDLLKDGTAEIVDFKTGAVPEVGAMKRYEAPQLLLEAAIAAAGGWTGVPPAVTSALTYVKIGLGPEAFVPSSFKTDGVPLEAATGEIVARLQRHVAEFLLKDTYPMTARLLPDLKQRFAGTYDHLARTAEWTVLEGEDEL